MIKTQSRRVLRKVFGTRKQHPNWQRILDKDAARWEAARAAARQGPPVLIATSIGGFEPATILESTLAVALTLRGAQVHILLCDEFLPACMEANIHRVPDDELASSGPQHRVCQTCFGPGYRMYQSLGLPVHRYSDFVTPEEVASAQALSATLPYDELSQYRDDGLAIGEHGWAGALRFYARGTLDDEPQGEAVARRYFQAALLTTAMARSLLATYPFTSACFHHGIYVPQGLIGEVARQHDVRVVNWNAAYRKRRFIFTHHDTYHHMLLAEPTSNWEQLPWTPELDAEVLDYLKSRWQGTRDWIWFHEKPREELTAIARELGVDFGKPCIGLLTNVMWDAQLHYRANAFPNMLEWTLQTIRYFAQRPELQLIIRVHPAEIRGTAPSRQPLVAEIERAFPTLPGNVFIIPPESNVSTYAVMLQCNAVIIYGTKTGVELTSMGVPVIVGGEAWIRNKGLTMDASSPREYFQLLDQLPLGEGLSAEVAERARKYAYHFFFRRMIPLPFMEPTQEWPPYRLELSDIEALLPGQTPGLDVICDGILNGSEFIYPSELYPKSLE